MFMKLYFMTLNNIFVTLHFFHIVSLYHFKISLPNFSLYKKNFIKVNLIIILSLFIIETFYMCELIII